VEIEVLYFDGCPSYAPLLPELRSLLADEGIETEIRLRRIDSVDAAETERFLGSPTVRIDGNDVEPDAGTRSDFGLKCRLYRDGDGHSPTPPEAWIRAALARAAA